jgi:hypothetical protein
MASSLSPQAVLIAYWLIILVVAAFSLRMACSLCRMDLPSWRRAFVSVVVVTFLAYLTWDFTCYLVLRSMDGVLLRVPPGYSFALWFREPIGLKWYIVSHSGFLKYLPFIFALCVAGVLQLVVLQAEVTFRFGLLIFLLQWFATAVAGYIVALLFGVTLSSIGWTPPQQTVAQAPPQPQAKGGRKQRIARTTGRRPRPGATAKGKQPAEVAKDAKGPGQAGDAAAGEPTSLQLIEREVGEAVKGSKEYLATAASNFKDYADPHLEEWKEMTAPYTRSLPESVQNFLDDQGWWWVLGFCTVVALLWVRSMWLRLRRAVRRSRKKGKKRRARVAKVIQRENLTRISSGFTEEGPRRVVVKGMAARLRLVVLSMGSQGGGGLSEEMADRVLDWISSGLAEVASFDTPGVRVWPPFYSEDGFATALQAHVPIPEPKGMKSHWVELAGAVRMGRLVIHVGLVLYVEEPSNLRFMKVKRERWLDFLAIEKTQATAGTR